ncbi:MAG: hypothetical protein FJ125_00970 [Deltaproteobacteria bacterium]|nr:hypothetical protein [Deltaproteobacteria bacterium]
MKGKVVQRPTLEPLGTIATRKAPKASLVQNEARRQAGSGYAIHHLANGLQGLHPVFRICTRPLVADDRFSSLDRRRLVFVRCFERGMAIVYPWPDKLTSSSDCPDYWSWVIDYLPQRQPGILDVVPQLSYLEVDIEELDRLGVRAEQEGGQAIRRYLPDWAWVPDGDGNLTEAALRQHGTVTGSGIDDLVLPAVAEELELSRRSVPRPFDKLITILLLLDYLRAGVQQIGGPGIRLVEVPVGMSFPLYPGTGKILLFNSSESVRILRDSGTSLIRMVGEPQPPRREPVAEARDWPYQARSR